MESQKSKYIIYYILKFLLTLLTLFTKSCKIRKTAISSVCLSEDDDTLGSIIYKTRKIFLKCPQKVYGSIYYKKCFGNHSIQ